MFKKGKPLHHSPSMMRLTLICITLTFVWIIYMVIELEQYQKEKRTHKLLLLDTIGPNGIPNLLENHRAPNTTTNDTKHAVDDYFKEFRKTPLLTLITTFNSSQLDRGVVHNNTLRNWANLIPYVQPVLYGDVKCDSNFGILIQNLGWKCKNPPGLKEGLPVVKSLFQDAMTSFSSHFYGYANADILFGSDLITSLMTIKVNYLFKFRRGFLLSGQRKNLLYSRIRSMDPNYLTKLRTKGRLYVPYALDYFIIAGTGFRWSRLPDLVVGRPGWDNYVVLKAFQWRISFIDASKTITALHQTGADGNDSGFHHGNNTNINLNTIGNFTWEIGRTTCAGYATAYDILGNGPIVYLRTYLGDECKLSKYKGKRN